MGHYHYDVPSFQRYLQVEKNHKCAEKEVLAQAEQHFGAGKIPKRFLKNLRKASKLAAYIHVENLLEETGEVFDSINGYKEYRYQSIGIAVRDALLTVPDELKKNELKITQRAFEECHEHVKTNKDVIVQRNDVEDEEDTSTKYHLVLAFDEDDIFLTRWTDLVGVIYHEDRTFRFLSYAVDATVDELETVVSLLQSIQKRFDPDGRV